MAYALGFPKDVTNLLMGMRNWRWEMVRDGGKTPSASCFNWHTDDMWKWDGYKGTTMCIIPMRGMPYYAIESDSEYSDNAHTMTAISIETYNPLKFFELRGSAGESPPKFIEFQIQDDRRIHDMAIQCEPCEP